MFEFERDVVDRYRYDLGRSRTVYTKRRLHVVDGGDRLANGRARFGSCQ